MSMYVGMPRTAVGRNLAPGCTGPCGGASTSRRLATYSFVIAGASPCATLRRLAPLAGPASGAPSA